MGIETLFFDTYAFFEILKGNPNYLNFVRGIAIVTTRLNLMELCYGVLISESKAAADNYYDFLVKFAVDIDDDIIKESVQFKANNKKRNLSYIDCIGYIIAMRNGIKFLTGDEMFKDLPNVKFIK